jgi:hypothetical protein
MRAGAARRRAVLVVSAWALVAATASAQSEARFAVTLPTVMQSGGDGPAFTTTRVLATTEQRELLRSGFPARLHFRCELWRSERLNNSLDAALEWDVVVRFDQLERKYDVYRLTGQSVLLLGRYDTVLEAEQMVDRPFRIKSPPLRRGARYYYDAKVDVEVLSLSDLDEVERWLRGEVRPTLRGQRNPGTTLTRSIRGFFVRLLGGERRVFVARSEVFAAP